MTDPLKKQIDDELGALAGAAALVTASAVGLAGASIVDGIRRRQQVRTAVKRHFGHLTRNESK